MQCDLCGIQSEEIFRAIIEETELNVCGKCAKFGKIISRKEARPEPTAEKARIKHFRAPEKEIMQVIVPDYAQKIKKKREEMGIKQKDFARMIAEKESVVHNIETGNFEPNIELALKIERFLKIKLVEEHEEEHSGIKSKDSGDGLTIGDLIKVK